MVKACFDPRTSCLPNVDQRAAASGVRSLGSVESSPRTGNAVFIVLAQELRAGGEISANGRELRVEQSPSIGHVAAHCTGLRKARSDALVLSVSAIPWQSNGDLQAHHVGSIVLPLAIHDLPRPIGRAICARAIHATKRSNDRVLR